MADKVFELTWTEFRNLPEVECVSDFHCVTGWSKLDNRWGGVKFKKIHDMAKPKDNAHFATIACDGGYMTSLPLGELLEDDVLLAYKLNGKDLETRFGGPLRLPKKYAYKSAKWVRKVKFTEQQELGYWELRGYSNTADPCREDRYTV
jgi:DMSO/TMAO reductase YedYZ molybdopterin-dependent catalytic subunit